MYKRYIGTIESGGVIRKLYYCLTDRKVQIFYKSGEVRAWMYMDHYFPTMRDAVKYLISHKVYSLDFKPGKSVIKEYC